MYTQLDYENKNNKCINLPSFFIYNITQYYIESLMTVQIIIHA